MVAVKQFKSTLDFAALRSVLEPLHRSKQSHANVAHHIAALAVGPESYAFFEWAKLDLQKFLDGEYGSHLQDGYVNPRQLAIQALELAGGLNFLHHDVQLGPEARYCCHLDLKRNNILIFTGHSRRGPLGLWKISDFGISEVKKSYPFSYNASSDDSQYTTISPKRHAAEFQPPEMEGPVLTQSGRKVDIWSFGYILLLILAHAMGGKDYVHELKKQKSKSNRGSSSD